MNINGEVECILDKGLAGEDLTKEEALTLMRVELHSAEAHALMWAGNKLTRDMTGNEATIAVQIGIDHGPCPGNCKFCSFAAGAALFEPSELTLDEVVTLAKEQDEAGASALSLMTTAAYDFDKYVHLAEAVKEAVSEDMPVIANIGDFGPEEARRLKKAGICFVYHAKRLREGTDTDIPPERRFATIRAAQEAGLPVGYGVDPVGPEHTYEEIVDEMFTAKEVSGGGGVFERVPVPGTPLHDRGTLSGPELAKMVAVNRLVVGRTGESVGHHECNLLCMCAGSNSVCVEIGGNPRDTAVDSAHGRGLSVRRAKAMLEQAGFSVTRKDWKGWVKEQAPRGGW